jgi:hypothetical protein
VLFPGDFINFAFDFSSDSRKITSILNKNGQPDFRMRDVELFIRFFGFHYFLQDYAGDLRSFLNLTCDRLNKSWNTEQNNIQGVAENLEYAIDVSRIIFGNNAFKKWNKENFESRFNRSIFDVMTYYFSDAAIAEAAKPVAEDVVKAFIDLSTNDQEFITSIESTTKSITATFTRLAKWGKKLEETLNISIGNKLQLAKDRLAE